jgi:hypothetical protein
MEVWRRGSWLPGRNRGPKGHRHKKGIGVVHVSTVISLKSMAGLEGQGDNTSGTMAPG